MNAGGWLFWFVGLPLGILLWLGALAVTILVVWFFVGTLAAGSSLQDENKEAEKK